MLSQRPLRLSPQFLYLTLQEGTMTFDQRLSHLVKASCKEALKELIVIDDLAPRRLLSVNETAAYLGISKREIYNLLTGKQLVRVSHRRRTMIDIRDLERWILERKVE